MEINYYKKQAVVGLYVPLRPPVKLPDLLSLCNATLQPEAHKSVAAHKRQSVSPHYPACGTLPQSQLLHQSFLHLAT